MTQNLRIINKTITPADSDVTSNYTIPTSSISGFSSHDTSNAYVDSDGGFYTWYTATAGTGTTAITVNGQNASSSICPKGWRLPTSKNNASDFQILYNNYDSSLVLRSSPVNLTLSGSVRGSSMYDQGLIGNYWSSTTAYTRYYAYLFSVTKPGGADPLYANYKHFGFSMRCITR